MSTDVAAVQPDDVAPVEPDDLNGRIAEEIRVAMIRRRVSGRQLGRILGVSPTWISLRLTGQQKIGVDDLERIARALHVRPVELFPLSDRVVTPVRPDTFAYPASSPLPHLRTSGRPVGHPGGSRGPSGGRRASTGPPSQTVGRFGATRLPVGGR